MNDEDRARRPYYLDTKRKNDENLQELQRKLNQTERLERQLIQKRFLYHFPKRRTPRQIIAKRVVITLATLAALGGCYSCVSKHTARSAYESTAD